jgi:glycosyltransferase involved in cell wall biosynthesis
MARRLDDVCVVVPTIGRRSLNRLLAALAAQQVPVRQVVVVDDRRVRDRPLQVPASLRPRAVVLASGGRGPAAARNVGWRASEFPWIVFLDDDVVPSPTWSLQLGEDLAVAEDVGATQARIAVPRPRGRRPTDRERNVTLLESADWITADMAVRRHALADVAGFDERFRRAYREDSDFALRLQERGWRLERGARRSTHPVQPAPWWASVTAQRGNRDDALMLALHGRNWRPDRGRRSRHAVIASAGVVAAVLAGTRHRRLAAIPAAIWFAGTTEFAATRIAAGPRHPSELATVLGTSVLIPPTAVAYWIAGRIAHPAGRTPAWKEHPEGDVSAGRRPGTKG